MATKPLKVKSSIKGTSNVDVLNAVRNAASANYKNMVPAANGTNAMEIGNIVMTYEAIKNEFANILNRIAKTIFSSRSYENPWAFFKKGVLEYGETIENIFINLAKPFNYDVEVAESKVFAREIPDVRTAFYTLNFKEFYKQTIQDNELRLAFLSADGLSTMISKIVDSMYAAANYDEFLIMKYLVARNILNGRMYPVQVDYSTEKGISETAAKFRAVSNNFTFMTKNYNPAAVQNYADRSEQYLILNSDFDAVMDVNVLATAFNMDKAEFLGHRALVDSFAELDDDRLADLMANDKNYVPLTDDEKNTLKNVPGVLVSGDWFQVYDNLLDFREQYNAQGLYWNYFYHTWKTFCTSPFEDAVVFTTETPTVESITISPSEVTCAAGQTVALTATVSTTGFASEVLNWTSNSEYCTVDIYGNCKVLSTAPSGTSITITATSDFDSTKSATATITVA